MNVPNDKEIIEWLADAADSYEQARMQEIAVDADLEDSGKGHQRQYVRAMHNAAKDYLRALRGKK